MLRIPFSKNYQWDLTPAGHPDMRRALNRRNVCDMATQLHRKLEETKSENKVLKAKETLKCDSMCAICMEEMSGTTILKCGHMMCASCFAQHSRVANTCPFCRDEFAPAPKKQREKMPVAISDAIADQWAAHHGDDGYFALVEQNVNQKEEGEERQTFLKWCVRENGKVLMRRVADWYDAET
jgi:hypothetical protein